MIARFLTDPLVAPLWGLAVLSLAVFVLTVWRSIEDAQFDLSKLPRILDTLVLRKLVPLALLGVAAKAVGDTTSADALTVAYAAGIAAAAAAELGQLIDAIRGNTIPAFSMTEPIVAPVVPSPPLSTSAGAPTAPSTSVPLNPPTAGAKP